MGYLVPVRDGPRVLPDWKSCWDIILADQELASIVGNGDALRGTAVLESMKDERALDQIKQDGRISE